MSTFGMLKTAMNNQIKQFEISSPEELQEALASSVKDGACFAGVRVFGQNLVTRQFNFPNSSPEDLIAGLKLEASETLSVDAADVEISYHITGTDEQGVHGIFLAMPRHLLMGYLECFKSHSLIPVSLTASTIGAVTDFLKDKPLPGDNFCLVNFLKPGAVSIIIFANARPTFFRELYDLSDNDFKGKITDTIRYCCSLSASKKIDQIFFVGDLTGKDALMKSLKELGHFSTEQPVSTGNVGKINFSNLNLFEKFVCGIQERTRLVLIFSLISIISITSGVFMAWDFANVYTKLHKANLKVNMSDYYRALDLQEKVRHLGL